MEFLKLLESIRNPVLDAFFSVITHLGEETVFMLIGLIFFWCVNKKQGYYILFVGFLGTVINQFLKLWFRIPRPWVKDPNFTIVESARAEATGYSFPSGHTQSSVGTFGCVARSRSEKWLRIISIVFCILVPLSRLYLGVHTPLDVGVSLVIAVVMIFALYPIIMRALENKTAMRIMLGIMTALTVAYIIFVEVYPFPADIDVHNFESGVKNGYKILGCFLGMWLTFELDEKFIHFETAASPLAQVLKIVLGVIPILAVKALLKSPLYALCGGSFIADGIRYFLIATVAGIIWPLTFKYFAKLGKKKA
ncbi:MAG: phosphatase PAP2 family protein [Ruminococcaceae bacterium]|nr:phosphatase PAP2 family protein [Oscillospiraceae bacterium]